MQKYQRLKINILLHLITTSLLEITIPKDNNSKS